MYHVIEEHWSDDEHHYTGDDDCVYAVVDEHHHPIGGLFTKRSEAEDFLEQLHSEESVV